MNFGVYNVTMTTCNYVEFIRVDSLFEKAAS